MLTKRFPRRLLWDNKRSNIMLHVRYELWAISAGLNFIHERDLIHGHLHGGNILIECEMESIDAKVTDTGLHGPVDKQVPSQQIYGVVPFVAPEIFNGNTATKASDIYSFGMIMWMLSAGKRPYHDRPHLFKKSA